MESRLKSLYSKKKKKKKCFKIAFFVSPLEINFEINSDLREIAKTVL